LIASAGSWIQTHRFFFFQSSSCSLLEATTQTMKQSLVSISLHPTKQISSPSLLHSAPAHPPPPPPPAPWFSLALSLNSLFRSTTWYTQVLHIL
jgi:hypothetical protein